MSVPFVSVIMPAYNSECFIRDAVLSVLNQTYTNFELIIIDDGSKDNTTNIIQEIKDKRITLIAQSNLGVSKARNSAIGIAKGEWLAFLDSDDIWLPTKLETQLNEVGEHKWSITNSLYFGRDDLEGKTRSDLTTIYDGHVFESLLLENFITTSTLMVKKDIFTSSGKFDEGLLALEDWKIWLHISTQYPLTYCDKVLAKYRVTQGSTSRKARAVLPLHLKVINDVFKATPHFDSRTKLYRQSKAKAYSICSYIAEDSSDPRYAFRCALSAFLIEPIKLEHFKRLLSTILKIR